MPACLIEDHHRMLALNDHLREAVEEHLHGRRIKMSAKALSVPGSTAAKM